MKAIINPIENECRPVVQSYLIACKVRDCDNEATMHDGTCERCYEEIHSLRGDLGGLSISHDDTFDRLDPVRLLMRFPVWARWLVFGLTCAAIVFTLWERTRP